MKDSVTNVILDSYDKRQIINQPKYITAQTGVRENPNAPPEKKEMHVISPPKVSTQHF